jgi:hypothetical protein
VDSSTADIPEVACSSQVKVCDRLLKPSVFAEVAVTAKLSRLPWAHQCIHDQRFDMEQKEDFTTSVCLSGIFLILTPQNPIPPES